MTQFDFLILGSGILGTYALSKLDSQSRIGLIDAGDALIGLKDVEISSNLSYTSNAIRHSFNASVGQIWGGATMGWPDFGQSDTGGIPNLPISDIELHKFENIARSKLSIQKKKYRRFQDSYPTDDSYFQNIYADISNDIFLNKINKLNKKHKNFTRLDNVVAIKILNRKNNLEIIAKNYSDDVIFTIATKKIILAMGTIENTRILLNSADQLEVFGNKFLGTNLADHLGVNLGEYKLLSSIFSSENTMEFKRISQNKWPRLRLVNKNIEVDSFAHVIKVNEPSLPYKMEKYISKLGVRRHQSLKGKTVQIQLFIEKVNDFNCKIFSVEKPSEDLLKIGIDFNLQSSELRTINAIAKKYNDFLITNKYAEKCESLEFIESRAITTACHPSGTLRMAASSELGLVSKKSLLFSNKNVMVLGAGVLPRAAAIHPTLVSMAIAELALS